MVLEAMKLRSEFMRHLKALAYGSIFVSVGAILIYLCSIIAKQFPAFGPILIVTIIAYATGSIILESEK
jgi:hypothetical protein